MQLNADSLNHLLEAIREAGPYVLAAPEDAEFFRKQRLAPKEAKPEKVLIPPAIPPSLPPPPFIPKPLPLALKTEKVTEKIEEKELVRQHSTLKPDLSGVRNLVSVVAPELAILSEIPSDAMARRIAERWKTKNQTAPISILLYQEPPEQRALLEQIAKAIDIYFGPAKIVSAEGIEKEKQWNAFLSVAELKLIIACDYTLWQLNGLMQFYKETPNQGIRTLGNTPLFLLPDLSLYLKDPSLKRSLWKALCQKCS